MNRRRSTDRDSDRDIDDEVRLAVRLTEFDARIQTAESNIERLEEDYKKAHAELVVINEAAIKWKGAFIVVVALGSIVGWIVSVGSNIAKALK